MPAASGFCAEPPAAAVAPEPFGRVPITNRPIKLGVEFVPSQTSHPAGTDGAARIGEVVGITVPRGKL